MILPRSQKLELPCSNIPQIAHHHLPAEHVTYKGENSDGRRYLVIPFSSKAEISGALFLFMHMCRDSCNFTLSAFILNLQIQLILTFLLTREYVLLCE
jgi:hypothetical protein